MGWLIGETVGVEGYDVHVRREILVERVLLG
jgi:hypothetical protein